MSTGFYILFSLVPERSDDPIEIYKKLLSLVLDSPNIRSDACGLKIYRGPGPFDTDDPNIVYQLPPGKGITPREVFRVIDSLKIDNIYVGVSLAYERLEWKNEICDSKPSAGPLIVEYEAPTYAGGYRHDRLGPYHLVFDERKHFALSAVDFSRCPADSPDAILKFTRFEQNTDIPVNLFKEIAWVIKPEHQVLVTEGDGINPLYFHMAYHNELSGYLFDLQKILQLHEVGGEYFHDGCSGDSDRPYRSLHFYGLPYEDGIRSRARALELGEKLDFYGSLLGRTGIGKSLLKDEEISHIINSLPYIEAESINSSMCVTASNFLLSYLDDLYLQLFDAAASKMLQKV